MIRKASFFDCPVENKKPKHNAFKAVNACQYTRKKENKFLDVKHCQKVNRIKTDIEYLELPNKLDSDHKEYRVIRLKNGLTALLISDNQSIESNNYEKKELSTLSDSGKININKNESSDIEKAAYCSLCINVGNFSDPPHIQGLAHLLEHMLSMGSKKYPKENEYDAFIQKRWGCCNAFTESERTVFSFYISENYLFEAMDRFAHLFIDPLIMKEAIIRERQAVESEFKLAQQSDSSRKLQLKNTFLRKNHPAANFSWGNLKTLRDNIDIDELHLELHKFRNRHYSAHRMTLAVQALAPLDVLEQAVIQCFSDVPVNNLSSDDFSQHVGIDSFDSSKFGRLYKVKTIKDVSELELCWVMPSMHDLYKTKPWEYILWLFNREDEGSLLHYLRKKMWCFEIFDWTDEAVEHNSMYCLCSLSLVLTDDGYKNFHEVLNAIFSYINLMKREGCSQTIFDEIKKRKENDFAVDYDKCEYFIENMSVNMQFYSPVNYLNGYDLIFEYDEKSIRNCINLLSPENVNIIVSSKEFNDKEFDQIEPWFETKYSSNEIPKQWISCWQSIETLPEFNLSLKSYSNNLTSSSNMICDLFDEVCHPVKIHHDNIVELWYKKVSSNFQLSMHLHLMIPATHDSPLCAVMTDLLIIILLAMRELSSSDIQIDLSMKGIFIEISGSNENSIVTLTKNVLDGLINCHKRVTEKMFNLAKREMSKQLYNNFIDPSNLNVEIWLSLMSPIFWSARDKHNALASLTCSEFINFTKTFSKSVFIQCLMTGTIADNSVAKIINETLKPLLNNSSPLTNYPFNRKANIFTRGEKCCQIKNLNCSDVNSVVTNYYQIGLASVKFVVISDLLTVMMEEPLFNHLRTQEQLGYQIHCDQMICHGVICVAITVVTQSNKFNAEYINERISNFINNFRNILAEMSDDEFSLIKENYIKLKYRHQAEYNDDTRNNWIEIVAGDYIFDRLDEEIKIAKNIVKEDVLLYVNDHLVVGANYRKLSVQVVGTPDSSKTDDESDDLNVSKYPLIFSTEITDDKKKHSGFYINDIQSFKSQLKAFL